MTDTDTQNKPKISGGIKFLSAVLVVYIIVAIFNIDLCKKSLIDFWGMFIKIIPLLLFVIVIMAIVNLFFTEKRTKKYLGESSGIKGWIFAIISGILISGPPYLLFPLLGDLRNHGMNDSLLAVFLYNRNVKIQFLPVLIYYFGLKFAIILSLYIILFSILNGIIVGRLTNKNICQNKY
ncbi:hypothetical protein ACFL2L_00565 [Patescibacteria group bacterium]